MLTHAHPDHAGGLAQGAPCPVYATGETLRLVRRFPIRDRHSMPLKKSVAIGGLRFKAYRVQHSIRAPAVGYRVSTKAGSFFYVPDVAGLPNVAEALGGVGVYIGDGATMRRSMVRVKERTLIGHAPITTQLDWCARAHLRRAIFTHCGSPIVREEPRALDASIRSLGRELGIDARLARDGDRLSFPGIGGQKDRVRLSFVSEPSERNNEVAAMHIPHELQDEFPDESHAHYAAQKKQLSVHAIDAPLRRGQRPDLSH